MKKWLIPFFSVVAAVGLAYYLNLRRSGKEPSLFSEVGNHLLKLPGVKQTVALLSPTTAAGIDLPPTEEDPRYESPAARALSKQFTRESLAANPKFLARLQAAAPREPRIAAFLAQAGYPTTAPSPN